MSSPCCSAFGKMRKTYLKPWLVSLTVAEPALSSGTSASSRIGMMASEASEHSSPSTICGLYSSSTRLTVWVAASGEQAESS